MYINSTVCSVLCTLVDDAKERARGDVGKECSYVIACHFLCVCARVCKLEVGVAHAAHDLTSLCSYVCECVCVIYTHIYNYILYILLLGFLLYWFAAFCCARIEKPSVCENVG